MSKLKDLEIIIELINPKTITPEDIEDLNDLESKIFGVGRYPRYFFRQVAEIFNETFIVARDQNNKIIAYLIGAQNEKNAWMLSMAVDEKYQRKGIASNMISTLIDIFKEKLVRNIYATVDPKNYSTINLYSKHGFRILRLEPDYHGIGHHRYLMKKSLD